MRENDVDAADWNPSSGKGDIWNDSPMRDLATDLERMGAPVVEGRGAEQSDKDPDNVLLELETPGPSIASSPLIPVPGFRNLSIQPPSSASPSAQLPPPVPTRDTGCTPSQAP